MATYVNDLRLKEIATGDESGTWGTSTNTNLELIGEAFGSGSEALSDASTATITMQNATSDAARALALTLTGSLSQALYCYFSTQRQLINAGLFRTQQETQLLFHKAQEPMS